MRPQLRGATVHARETAMSIHSETPLTAERIALMQAALRTNDPGAELNVDRASGQLDIVTSLPAHEVLAVLGRFGAKPELVADGNAPADDGGCCGCCGG
ncbi:hypothetical protein [Xanthomonas euvesicatoria]|uniref:hypothetical protein n=2 Tax=Xanthomonas euvesicatoria TaxID=456327 RepID=UPI001D82BB99|nr:hypothetical protein [Xanthomonas campestris pv. fici]